MRHTRVPHALLLGRAQPNREPCGLECLDDVHGGDHVIAPVGREGHVAGLPQLALSAVAQDARRCAGMTTPASSDADEHPHSRFSCAADVPPRAGFVPHWVRSDKPGTAPRLTDQLFAANARRFGRE
jgi:hypothetical protein